MSTGNEQVQAQMEPVCDLPDGRTLFYADPESFDDPGYKVWDDETGQHLSVRFEVVGAEGGGEKVDHRAEAKRLIEADVPDQFGGRSQPYPYAPAEAQVHASLAIAEQLERLNEGRGDSDLREHLSAYCKRWIKHHAKEEEAAISESGCESHSAAKDAFADVLRQVESA